MRKKMKLLGIASTFLAVAMAACAAPAPAATPTGLPAAALTPTKAAPTPTKAPTATPTKRPLVKTPIITSGFFTTMMPAWVARGKGYFEDEGLDVDWVVISGGAKALAGVVSQEALLGMVAPADIVTAIDQGIPVQTFAMLTVGSHSDLVMRKETAEAKGITEKSPLAERVNAARGLRLGVSTPGGGTDIALRFVLTKYNIDPDRDVEITYLAAAARNEAFYRGAIDAMMSTQPETSKVILEVKTIMLVNFAAGEVPETRDVVSMTGVAHKNIIAANPEPLEAFARGVWRGQRLIQQNRDDAREAARSSTWPDMEPAIFEEAFSAIAKTLVASPEMTERHFQATVDYRSKTAAGPPLSITFDQFYTNRFVEAAKKQLGF